MTWEGKSKDLPGVVLNSHYDVVDTFDEFWVHPPWEAEMDEQGNIYGRGTQDMKSVGVQYLEAIRKLKFENNFQPERTIWLIFVPDEERNGSFGMVPFLETDNFKSMNIGFVLDEGLANVGEDFWVFDGERSNRGVKVTFIGDVGHGSRFIPNSCGAKITKFLQKVYDFREKEEARLGLNGSNTCMQLGEVTTMNLTQMSGGIAHNVVPQEMKLTIDCRVPTDVEIPEFEAQMTRWTQECGSGVAWEYLAENPLREHSITHLDAHNVFWKTFKETFGNLGLNMRMSTFPAASDSRFIRQKGIACIGFSPINKTKVLLHDHNEYINVDIFLKGIDIYVP